MNLDLTSDQLTLQTAIEQLADHHRTVPTGTIDHFVPGVALERDLEENGFFDVARQDDMGAVEAALLIETIAQLPFTVEVGASALVAPMVLPGQVLPRPIALARAPFTGPVRYLTTAKTALIDTGNDVRLIDLTGANIEPVKTPFAYPYGRLTEGDIAKAKVLKGVSPALLRQWWQVSLAVEIYGVAKAAVDLTVQYVKDRRQFNRPIGQFQSVQHRLAECTMLVHGTRILARRAAWSGKASDAAEAAAYAQEAATRIHYDTHQFHGAMGITAEYPLHLWSFRLKALQGELGGQFEQAKAAAVAHWGA